MKIKAQLLQTPSKRSPSDGMSATAEAIPTFAPVTKMALAKVEEWYRIYLTMLRAAAATMSPAPLPSAYPDLAKWITKFTKWLRKQLSVPIASSIACDGKHKVALMNKIKTGRKEDKIVTVIHIHMEIWQLFWRPDLVQDRITRDPIFQVTDADREYLTMTVCALDLGNVTKPGRLIWNTFSLSPTIWERAPIYMACSVDDTTLAKTIELESLDCVSELNADWCYTMAKASARAKQNHLVDWLIKHPRLSDDQKDTIRSVNSNDDNDDLPSTARLMLLAKMLTDLQNMTNS